MAGMHAALNRQAEARTRFFTKRFAGFQGPPGFSLLEHASGTTRYHGGIAQAFETAPVGGPERFHRHYLVKRLLQIVRPLKLNRCPVQARFEILFNTLMGMKADWRPERFLA